MSTNKPAIICVAITGSLPRKSDNPAVPISVEEQIESAHAAFEAGATICQPMFETTMKARLPIRISLPVSRRG